MLAVAYPSAFADPGWWFETKWDGVRALVVWDGTRPRVKGRRGGDITHRYPELAGFSAGPPLILDGEIVLLGDDGVPSFEGLQSRMHLEDPAAAARLAAEHPVAYVAFDVLHHGGSLVSEPLRRRREVLESLVLPPPVAVPEVVEGDGPALWEAVVARGLEGIVAKRRDSPYRPGVRSPDWRKIANVRVARAVVGGFTPGEGGRRGTFGALLLGLWDGPALRFVGSVGTGFSDRDLGQIRAALDESKADLPPFHPDPGLPPGAIWVHPALVASVGYRDWTSAGRLRHPRFRGFTGDPVGEVTVEAEWG
jgi:bifunctional non-homologous end joining protein LigD